MRCTQYMHGGMVVWCWGRGCWVIGLLVSEDLGGGRMVNSDEWRYGSKGEGEECRGENKGKHAYVYGFVAVL